MTQRIAEQEAVRKAIFCHQVPKVRRHEGKQDLRTSTIDTLRVHSTSIITEQNHLMQGGIAVFYNGDLVTSVNWLPDTDDATGGVYYFENEEVVSTQDSAYPIPWILRIAKEVEETDN